MALLAKLLDLTSFLQLNSCSFFTGIVMVVPTLTTKHCKRLYKQSAQSCDTTVLWLRPLHAGLSQPFHESNNIFCGQICRKRKWHIGHVPFYCLPNQKSLWFFHKYTLSISTGNSVAMKFPSKVIGGHEDSLSLKSPNALCLSWFKWRHTIALTFKSPH